MTLFRERRGIGLEYSPQKAISIFFSIFLLFEYCVLPVQAQQSPTTSQDSLLHYDLAEIVVSDGSVFEAESNTVNKVTIAEISRKNASAVSDLARLIPAAHIQTNSRGESLIYLRNAGERQVALFFNGALLNVPWDNRMNLDLVPANVIGGITVAKGVPSVLYGTNVLGGAINITSRAIDYEGSVTEVGGYYGDASNANYTLAHLFSKGGFKFSGAAGYNSRDGLPLPDVTLFSQQSSSIRSNTDRSVLNLFGQGSYTFDSGAEVGLSYLMIDGDFGIAPEGHVDPAVESVRFWRYPRFNNSTLVLNASFFPSTSSVVRGAIWGSWFEQDIDSYASDAYEVLEEQQQDQDKTAGVRVTLTQNVGAGQLSLALNGLQSQHQEIVLEPQEDGSFSAGGASPDVYKQFVYSVGTEYLAPVSDRLRATVGVSLDGIATPETGDKPDRDPQTGFGMAAGLQYRLQDDLLLRATAGRKVRFPTMRELFGVALNRFLLNPDLKPESSFVTEVAVARQGSMLSGEIVAFYQRTFDTIDQERVVVDDVSLRRRINLEGSRVFGVELVGKARPMQGIILDGHLTLMKPRGLEADDTVFLTEKPAVLGSLSLTHNHASGVSFTGQATYTGRAYGRNEVNEFVPLVKSTVIDAKAGYIFGLSNNSIFSEVFVRVDNIFNAETLPQLGLPGAGRLFRAGLNVTF